MKSWYKIVAPPYFESKEIGETAAADPKLLTNRIIPINYAFFSGNYTQSSVYTKLRFRIVNVNGEVAETEYIGHRISDAYLKTIVRRRRSVIHTILDAETKDGKKVRLWFVILTPKKISTKKQTDIRNKTVELIREYLKQKNYPTLAKEILEEKVQSFLISHLKKINPIARIEVKKLELRK